MDNKRCNIKECKAVCCYNVPIPKSYLTAFSKKIENKVIAVQLCKNPSIGSEETVYPITDMDEAKNKCPFLNIHNRCNIYGSRPKLCRMFGSRDDILMMKCQHLTGKVEMTPQLMAEYIKNMEEHMDDLK